MQASAIQLLSTDFDGTLVHIEEAPTIERDLEAAISEVRAEGGIWAINTGRSLDLTLLGLRQGEFSITPDFILSNEREIHLHHEQKWIGLDSWNDRCFADLDLLFRESADLIEAACRCAKKMGCENIIKELGRPVGFITKTEKQMDAICYEIDLLNTSSTSILKYQRNSIYLRFCHKDYHKGSSLLALSEYLNIERKGVFAVGDQHNDLPMLDPSIAGMLACPANSIPEVLSAVRNSGGYVASEAYGLGVLEAIEFFTKGGLSQEFAA